MRRLTAALCALTLLSTGAQAQTIKDFLAVAMKKWTAPFEPFQLIDNIYYVGTDGIAVYVIKTSQGLILMDTAMPQSTGMIKDNIAKLGFKVADIKLILNTHAHLDHTGGFAEIKKETGAQLVAGERDKPLLEGGYYPGDEKNEDLAFPAVKVDRAVKEGDRVTLGDTTLTAHPTPGHSPGCTSWEMTVKDGKEDREVLFFCSGTVALNRRGRPADLCRHRRRLPRDFRQGQGDEDRRAARAASGSLWHAGQARRDEGWRAEPVHQAGRARDLRDQPVGGFRQAARQADRGAGEEIASSDAAFHLSSGGERCGNRLRRHT
ncbi:glyoxylase-like metal-dependent hydrolase (beta-lactamase superfamily II) [Bradyrhizobium japonicum]